MAGTGEGGMVLRKYPWEEWFKRPRTVLLLGIHYSCSQSTMCQTIRNNASMRGLRVRLTDMGTEIIIEVISKAPRAERRRKYKGIIVEIPRPDTTALVS